MANSSAAVSLDAVQALIGEEGYEVSRDDTDLLKIREVESDIVIRAVLEENIAFFSVSCSVVPESTVTPEMMSKMLDAGNGISTSSFQLYRRADGQTAIALNNFCKLQALGADDRDDILSCLEFLIVDVYAAKELLAAGD